MQKFHSVNIILILFCLALLGGCSSRLMGESEKDNTAKIEDMTASQRGIVRRDDDEEVEKVRPVEEMYNKAAEVLDKGDNYEAAQLFDEVERVHPYSQWATKAQLMSAFAHYKALRYDDAILALERFIQLHPGDENIAYAYYLRGISYYEQISDVRRDQKMTELALENLRAVTQRFPESQYARDAALKVDLTYDHLAGKEMEIGRYYLEREHFNAAINRFQNVIDDYQTTTHVQEALHRMVEAYLSLGVMHEAQKAAAVLGYNYPDSDWYLKSYRLLKGQGSAGDLTVPQEESVFDRTLGRIF